MKALFFAPLLLVACGGGVPVELRLDEFTLEVDIDAVVDGAFAVQGLVPGATSFPEVWPDSLPDIQTRVRIVAPSVPIDLTPEAGDPDDPEADAEAGKYDPINTIGDVVQRIEINRFVMRIEQSTLTQPLPELRLQVADTIDARADDRLAWRTVGLLPGTDAGFVGDVEFSFVPGGESYFNAQLGDDVKECAMRVVGTFVIDTEHNPRRPSGRAVIRPIAEATFFLAPEGAL